MDLDSSENSQYKHITGYFGNNVDSDENSFESSQRNNIVEDHNEIQQSSGNLEEQIERIKITLIESNNPIKAEVSNENLNNSISGISSFDNFNEGEEQNDKNNFLGKKTKLPKENEENEENENQKNEENEKKEKNEENEIFKVIYDEKYIENAKEVICNNEYDTKISSNVSKENDDFSTSVQTIKKNDENEIKCKDEPKNIKKKEKNENRNDYVFPKLCKYINILIEKKCQKSLKDENFKLNSPIRELSTLNLSEQYIFLNIPIKNRITMNIKDKYEFDRLLYDIGIIKKFDEEKIANLNKKECKKALKLLKKFKYINENENFEKNKIKELLIKLLKEKELKKDNENNFYKKDKYIFKILLYENGITKSRNNQENNMKKNKKLEEKKYMN